MSSRLGIDTGGTFNDFVLIDDVGRVHTAKAPSNPSDPAAAIAEGLARLGVSEPVGSVVVGTTVATNAVIQRRGPTVAFVSNEGFTDVPFIGRTDKERLYDLDWRKPRPLVQRAHCFGVGGRIGSRGDVLEPIDGTSLRRLAAGLAELPQGELAVAISCLFSYLDPSHERAIAETVRATRPDAAVSVSHQVSPIWREFERASTTLADVFVKPVVRGYVAAMRRVLEDALGTGSWTVLGSNGGYLAADQALAIPVRLLLSGLAGGVVGADAHVREAGERSAFTLDMGGTSADIGLILDGTAQFASEFDIEWGVPVSIPCVDVTTIGAGGGSVAWVDKGGLLHVGPESVGADPGPAAYGQGGDRPTITDANVVLGRLDPDYFLGGAIRLHADAAHAAYERLGANLGMSAEQAALAAVRTADENMANAVRLVAVGRGVDTREFALVAFGGAGPLHARAVGERIGSRRILIPPHPGLCSAFGAAISQARVDRMQTFFARSDRIDLERLQQAERGLRQRVAEELRATTGEAPVAVDRAASIRYAGQNYEVEVRIGDGELDATGWAHLLDDFAAQHLGRYGFELPGETVELVHLSATATGAPVDHARTTAADVSAGGKRAGTRRVWLDADAPADCLIHRRVDLGPGARFVGPAIVEEPDSTTLIGPGDRVEVTDGGTLVIEIERGP